MNNIINKFQKFNSYLIASSMGYIFKKRLIETQVSDFTYKIIRNDNGITGGLLQFDRYGEKSELITFNELDLISIYDFKALLKKCGRYLFTGTVEQLQEIFRYESGMPHVTGKMEVRKVI